MEEWKNKVYKYLFSLNSADIDFYQGIKIKNDKIPKRLFKYYRISRNSVRGFKKNIVWCANPSIFNDPYDTMLKVELTDKFKNDLWKPKIIGRLTKSSTPLKKRDIKFLETSKDIIKDSLRILKTYHPLLTDKKAEVIEKLFNNIFNLNVKKQNQVLNDYIRDCLRVSCFSKSINSMSMWYHYAKEHTGFVLEYDFSKNDISSKIRSALWPVFYTESLLDVSPYFIQHFWDRAINLPLSIYASTLKSSDWEYEKEWRLILNSTNHENGINQALPNPVAIYLGVKIKPRNKSRLINIALSKNIPIFEMKPSKSSYLMVPRSIKIIKKSGN